MNIKSIQQKSKQVKPADKKGAFENVPKWAPVAVLTFTALLYIRALYNGFANWDDDYYILNNPFIRDFSLNGVKAIFLSFYYSNYHPLTTLTYLFEYTWCGANPFLYHLSNVLLHLLNTWLVFKVAEQLSGKKITALVVSLLFAVHPMHVESVAWISERKDVLYTLFYLLSMLVYLRYLKSGYQTKHYIGVLLFFVASLLSKPAAVTLPVLLIALDAYKGRKINTRSLLEKVPFLLLSLFFGILAVLSQKAGKSINDFSLSYSFAERIFLFTYAIAFYIVKLVVPFSLSAMHYFPNTHGGAFPWQYYASLPFLLFIVWLVTKRNLFQKEIVFGVFFFLITISVMLQIVSVGSAITAERYTYVPYIGLFYLAGQWFSGIIQKPARNFAMVILLLFVIMFSCQTYARIGVWKDGNVLFTDVIKKNPDYFHGYWIRGNVKSKKGDLQGALHDYNKTLEYNPKYVTCLIMRGDVRNKLNDYKGALQDMNLAISLDSTIAEAYNNRGMANYGLGNIKSSILDYNKAILLNPGFAMIYNNRGSAYDGLGDTKLALLDYNKAILMDPELAIAYNNRAVLKAKTGAISEAIKDINITIKLTPDYAEAYGNRGNIKAMQKDYKGSFEDYNYSLKLKPNDGKVYYNRGVACLYLK